MQGSTPQTRHNASRYAQSTVLARAAALNPVTLRRMHQHVNPPTPECLQENMTLSRHLLVRAIIPYPSATRPFSPTCIFAFCLLVPTLWRKCSCATCLL